jgi:hypothetical protein
MLSLWTIGRIVYGCVIILTKKPWLDGGQNGRAFFWSHLTSLATECVAEDSHAVAGPVTTPLCCIVPAAFLVFCWQLASGFCEWHGSVALAIWHSE